MLGEIDISPERFVRQLRWLARRRCVVPLIETLGPSTSSRRIAITFDDGYRDNLTVALPLLEKFQLPMTLFVTAGFVDREGYLSEEELGELSRHPLITIGAHGLWHRDFNHLELRKLDRALKSPHHLTIFEGGHGWLSSDLAVEAIEWMEIQAMKSGRQQKDDALLEKIFAKRVAQLAAESGDPAALLALEGLVSDFEGLKDVSEYATRVAALRRQKAVFEALKKERSEEQREERMITELATLENDLGAAEKRGSSLAQLKDLLSNLSRQSNAPEDSSTRRMARRVLRGTIVGSVERVKDPEYQKVLDALRPATRPRG